MKRLISLTALLSVCLLLVSCGLFKADPLKTVCGKYDVTFSLQKVAEFASAEIDPDVTVDFDFLNNIKFDRNLDLTLTLNANNQFTLETSVKGFDSLASGIKDSVKEYLTDGGIYTIMDTLYGIDPESVDKNIASRGLSLEESAEQICILLDTDTIRNETFASLSEMFGGLSFVKKGDVYVAEGRFQVFEDYSLTLDKLLNFTFENDSLILTSINNDENLDELLSSAYIPENQNDDVKCFNESVKIIKSETN